MTAPTTLNAVWDRLLEARMEAYWTKFHGPMPGTIETWDSAAQRAAVAPAVHYVLDAQDTEEIAPLQEVPVAFPGTASTAITLPISRGDVVLLLPSEVDLSAYLSAASVGQAPPTPRRFSLSDVIALPVFIRSTQTALPAAALASDGPVVWAPKIYLGGSDASDWVALASKVDAELQAIKTALDTPHTHGGVTTGGGTSGGASAAAYSPDPDGVGSEVVATK